MKQEILVKVEHMNKRFGSTVALKDVSIEVCSGRVLGLIGENGSGKSTVTSIIGYVGGYDMDDAWFGKCAQMAQTPDLEVRIRKLFRCHQ